MFGCGEEQSFLKSSTGVSQIGWPGRGDPEASTTSRIMEKVLILHFPPTDVRPTKTRSTCAKVSYIHILSKLSAQSLSRTSHSQLENLSFKFCMSDGLEGLNHEPFQERQLLMGHECVSIKESDDFVSVTASFIKDGKPMERNIRCNIVVGTDGAGSTVRKLAGGVLVAHDLEQGEFVLQIPFYPPQQNLEDFSRQVFSLRISNLMEIVLLDLMTDTKFRAFFYFYGHWCPGRITLTLRK
ncbi:hypothetical protein D8674_016541 [Pyrus ussuriensis x Pyrus communis]|uniref:Uncharacterized protein n=1 Tax=Pyrus ussuriensis x Pyrus communis TaxID=2448454 RepID=A0A5N5HFB1_9ROSA|nr:hypothetical protein D8674_016541 [Pyrus ussuriensis x Pyrus communis]